MKLKICASLIFLSLVACNNSKQEQAKLQKEVIDDHDVLMAKMDELMNNKLKLDSLNNSLVVILEKNPSTDTVALKSTIDSLKTELTKADDAMMNWMHQFNPDYTGKSDEEIIQYLNDQKSKIDSVKVLFNQSLSGSQQLISKY